MWLTLKSKCVEIFEKFLSLMENLENSWPFAVGFMEKSWMKTEKSQWMNDSSLKIKVCQKQVPLTSLIKYINGKEKKVSSFVKELNFSAFWMFAEKCLTLQACGIPTSRSTQTHGKIVSISFVWYPSFFLKRCHGWGYNDHLKKWTHLIILQNNNFCPE